MWVALADMDLEAKMEGKWRDMGRMAGIFVPEVPQKLGALVAQAVQVKVFESFQDTADKEVLLGELQTLVAKGKKKVDKGVCVLGPQAGLQIVLQVSVQAEMRG